MTRSISGADQGHGDSEVDLTESISMGNTHSKLLTAQRGTPRWMAVLHQQATARLKVCVLQPELCAHEVKIQAKYMSAGKMTGKDKQTKLALARAFEAANVKIEGDGMKLDSYAFGCCLYEIMAHKPPWEGVSSTNDVLSMVSTLTQVWLLAEPCCAGGGGAAARSRA